MKKDYWPKAPTWFYMTPDGIIQVTLACLALFAFSLYLKEVVTNNQILNMKESYSSDFCRLRARVDTISSYIGLPRS